MARLTGTLHPPGTPWIGRAEVLSSLVAALDDAPGLCTLRGPGGAGKTRLALRAAQATRLPAWGCALENAHSADDLVVELARVLGRAGADADALGETLGALGPAVLVLDNLEQLDDDAARQIGRWHQAAPKLRVLATSRRPLGLQAERLIDIGALAADEAVALFVERVSRRRVGYAPGDAERVRIRHLTTRLDRLPLAVELAAGRAATLGLDGLEARLGPHLSDGNVDRAPRHATLEATVRWSWDLLDDAEREVLAGVALLPGPVRAADAEWLGPDADLALGRLAEVSLLRAVDTGEGGRAWVHYETVRRWAVGHVTPEARARCVSHLLAAEPDRDALLALAESTEAAGETELLVALALALDPLLFRTGPEGRRRELLHAVLAAVPERDARHTEALVSLAMTGLEPALIPALQRAVEHADDDVTRGRAALALAQESFNRSDLDQADVWAERARVAGEAAGAHRIALGGRFMAAGIRAAEGDGRGARAAYEDALAWTQAHGAGDEGLLLGQLGSVALDLGDPDATGLLEAAIAALEGDHRRALSMAKLGEARLEAGDVEGAREVVQAALEVLRTTNHLRFEGYVLGFVGLVLEAAGEVREARDTLARAEAANAGRGHPVLGAIIAAWRGRLEADAGLPAAAVAHLERSDAVLSGGKLGRLPQVCGGHVLLAEARAELAAGSHPEPSLARVRTLLAQTAEGPPASEVRIARTRLWAALSGLEAARPVEQLVIGPDTTWFQLGTDAPVDVSSRHPIRRVLARLVAAQGEEALDVPALFEAGWPGETAVLKAQRNRVYHALATLRKWGLEPWLERGEEGWSLAPGLAVRPAPGDPSGPVQN